MQTDLKKAGVGRMFRTKKLYFQIFGGLCLLSVVILLFFGFYTNAVYGGEKRRNLHRIHALRLQKICDGIERTLDLLAGAIEQTLWTNDFITALINPEGIDDMASQRIVRNLESQKAANEMIVKMFLVSGTSSTVYHSDNYYMPWEYSREASVCERYWQEYEPDLHPGNESGEWTAMVWKQKVYLIVDMKTPYYLGSCFMELQPERLREVLGADSEKEKILVYDKDGTSILGTEAAYGDWGGDTLQVLEADRIEQYDLAKSGSSAYQVVGNRIDWTYVMVPLLPSGSSLLQRIPMLLPIILLSAVFCVLLSYLISQRVYAPIRSLLKAAMEGGEGTEVFSEAELISMKMQGDAESRRQMEAFVRSMSRDILEQVIRKYIVGRDTEEDYIREALQGIGAGSLLSGRYVVISGGYYYTGNSLPHILESNLYNRSLIELVWRLKYDSLVLCPVIFGNMNLIACCFEESAPSPYIQRTLTAIKNEVSQLAQGQPFTVITESSRVSPDIMDLRSLWAEAKEKVQFRQYLGEEKLDKEERNDPIIKKYVSERIRRFLEMAAAGKTAPAKERLDSILKQMQMEGAGHEKEWQYILVAQMTEALLEMRIPVEEIQRLQIHNGIKRVNQWESMDEFACYYRKFCHDIIQNVAMENKKKSYRYVDEAKTYIQGHFADCALSLPEISTSVGISASYLSTLFVEVTGTNFISYLNGYRVDLAKKLLEATNLPALEIGFRCGFHSNQTFYRVFKKYTGMAPNQYRETKRKEEKGE